MIRVGENSLIFAKIYFPRHDDRVSSRWQYTIITTAIYRHGDGDTIFTRWKPVFFECCRLSVLFLFNILIFLFNILNTVVIYQNYRFEIRVYTMWNYYFRLNIKMAIGGGRFKNKFTFIICKLLFCILRHIVM